MGVASRVEVEVWCLALGFGENGKEKDNKKKKKEDQSGRFAPLLRTKGGNETLSFVFLHPSLITFIPHSPFLSFIIIP